MLSGLPAQSARDARLPSVPGVGVYSNAFAIEGFLDEIANELGKDPIAFRLDLSQGSAARAGFLRAVSAMFDWHTARQGRGLGVAVMEIRKRLTAAARKTEGRWPANDLGEA